MSDNQNLLAGQRRALILDEVLRRREAIDLAFARDFLGRQKKSLQVPWMLAMARDQAYDFATGTEVAAAWRRALTSRLSWPVFNAITAAKLIWKLAPSTDAGCNSSTTAAASAKPRIEIGRRPANSATVASAAMAKLRCIGTPEPVSSM